MSTDPWQNPDGAPKPPLLTAMLHRLAIPKSDEASAGLKVQIQPELPLQGASWVPGTEQSTFWW